MFVLEAKTSFKRAYKKLTKKNLVLRDKIDEVLEKLALNPQDKSLGSHKVASAKFGWVWSCRVNGDIRILWEYDQNDGVVILLLTVGGHDQVY